MATTIRDLLVKVGVEVDGNENVDLLSESLTSLVTVAAAAVAAIL